MKSTFSIGRVVLVAVIALVLSALLMPASASAQEPAGASPLYLPLIGYDIPVVYPRWFTPEELEATQREAGFDPFAVSMHTWCYLADEADPDNGIILYMLCYQNTDANGDPSDVERYGYRRNWSGEMIWWWEWLGQ